MFEKKGYSVDWRELQKQSLEHTINALAMASPFSHEENKSYLSLKI